MKTYRAALKNSVIAALFGVPVGAVIGGLGIGLYYFFSERVDGPRFSDAILTGLTFSLFAALLGIIPALVYGAPVHALLSRRGISNYLSSTAIGAAPGAVMTAAAPSEGIGLFTLIFGACMAIAGQWFANRRGASEVQRQ